MIDLTRSTQTGVFHSTKLLSYLDSKLSKLDTLKQGGLVSKQVLFQVSVGDDVDVTDQVCRENIYETVEKFQVTLFQILLRIPERNYIVMRTFVRSR